MTSSDPYIEPTYWQRVNVVFINANPFISSIKEDIKMLTDSITPFQATDKAQNLVFTIHLSLIYKND